MTSAQSIHQYTQIEGEDQLEKLKDVEVLKDAVRELAAQKG